MENIRLLIFDWDGTLVDSVKMITDCLQDAFLHCELPHLSENKAKSIIGLPLLTAIKKLTPDYSDSLRKEILEHYKKQFLNKTDGGIPLFPGVKDAILKWAERGLIMAVATGKSRAGLNRDFQTTGLKEYFTLSRTVDECNAKPDPQMINDILEKTRIKAESALMIGDTTFDLEMAKNANVKSLGSCYGAHVKDELIIHSPLHIFNSFNEMSTWIDKQI